MEIISVKVGSPSQSTKVSVEAPTQIKATFKDVVVNNGGGSVKSVNGQTGDVVLDAAAVGALPNTTKIPANTSDLTNDSGFITRTVSDLANYYLKSETYSKAELDNKISAIPKFSIEVVTSLPTSNISDTTVYLVASGNEEDNLYTEYIYVNGEWEYLGKQTVDLTGYVQRTELSAYYTSIEIDSLLTTIRNSIPIKLSQLTEDSSHRTITDAERTAWNNKQPAGNYALQSEVDSLSEEIANSYADWGNNTERTKGYIFNRTHWTEVSKVNAILETQAEFSDGMCALETAIDLSIGNTYLFEFGTGSSSTCTAQEYVEDDVAFGIMLSTEVAVVISVYDELVEALGAPTIIITDPAYTSMTVNIYEAQETVHKLPSKYIPDEYVTDNTPSYVKEEAERVADQVFTHQNASTFSFLAIDSIHHNLTDAQSIETSEHAGQGMNLVRKGVHIDFVTTLGDHVWGTNGSDVTIENSIAEIRSANKCIDEAFRGVPNMRVYGNHDNVISNYATNSDYLDGNELFPMFGAYNTGAVFQHDEKHRGYCYRDFEEHRLRVICLNTCDISDYEPTSTTAQNNVYISGTQLKWLAESIDLSSKDDAKAWSILLLSHHPLDFGSPIRAVKILKAYLEGTSVSMSYDGVEFSYDYAEKNQATIIANVHGHNHNFKVDNLHYYVSDTETASIGIKRIGIPNACFTRNNERGTPADTVDVFDIDFGEDTTYDKTAGTAEDTAFCVITVDTKDRMIYADHYGAGYSREIEYLGSTFVSYTNQVPIAVGTDGNVFNGVGYKNGTYASEASEGTDSAYVTTGFMPYKLANGTFPTIYVKGLPWSGQSHDRIYYYNSAFTTLYESGINLFAKGDLSHLYTMEQLGTNYFKLTPTSALNSCVKSSEIAYMRMSLKGIGANLTITFDEPIE